MKYQKIKVDFVNSEKSLLCFQAASASVKQGVLGRLAITIGVPASFHLGGCNGRAQIGRASCRERV